MIGFYNYTMLLTYLSLISAGAGIFVALDGGGHPYLGTFFLLFCGLCDAFDGRVARTKANRSDAEKRFGIQVDSLADLLAFGALPACIGVAMLRCSPVIAGLKEHLAGGWVLKLMMLALFAVLILYILAAMIRLAYFNVAEEERQRTEGGVRRFYTGLPVTSAALIFPAVQLLQYLIPADITLFYFGAIVLTGFAFLLKFRVRKPGMRGVWLLVALGALEFLAMLLFRCSLRP